MAGPLQPLATVQPGPVSAHLSGLTRLSICHPSKTCMQRPQHSPGRPKPQINHNPSHDPCLWNTTRCTLPASDHSQSTPFHFTPVSGETLPNWFVDGKFSVAAKVWLAQRSCTRGSLSSVWDPQLSAHLSGWDLDEEATEEDVQVGDMECMLQV